MQQVGEFVIAEGIVTDVLNHATAIGVSMGFMNLFFRSRWKALEERRTNSGVPGNVYEFLVR